MSSALQSQNQKALSAIATAKANVTQQIASIEQNRQVQVQNSRARQNALAQEQRVLKEQLRNANTVIAQQKAQQALNLVSFKKELESNFEKRQKNALATIQMQKNVAAKKVINANTDLEKMKAKQELEFQERLLKMKLQEKTFLDQRLNGMLNLTEKEKNDFKKMYETSSLDEVIQKASELNEQKGLNKKVTEAAVANAKQEAVNAKAKENAAKKEAQNAKNAQRTAEQAVKNAQTAAQIKAAQNEANAARKRAENAERKVSAAQKEKVMNSNALVAQLTAVIQETKKVPVSTNNAQAQKMKNDQITKLQAQLENAKKAQNAAKKNANARVSAANAARAKAVSNANAVKKNANARVSAANAAKANAYAAKKNANVRVSAANAAKAKAVSNANAAKKNANARVSAANAARAKAVSNANVAVKKATNNATERVSAANAARAKAVSNANAAKASAAAQVNAAKKEANTAMRNAVAAANAKAKAEQALMKTASNANKRKLQNAFNAAKRQWNNAQRKLQQELENSQQLLSQLQSQQVAVNARQQQQVQAQVVAIQNQLGKQNRTDPSVKPPNAKPPNAKPPNKPPNKSPNVPKPVNVSNNPNVRKAQEDLAKEQELARIAEQRRQVARVEEEAKKTHEEGRRLALEREELNKKAREAKTEEDKRAAEEKKRLVNEELARVAKEQAAAKKKEKLFGNGGGGDETYLNQYLKATGVDLNSVNVATYKAKVTKDIKLAQLEANAKGNKGGFLGLMRAKPELEYVNEGQYNKRLQKAQTLVNVITERKKKAEENKEEANAAKAKKKQNAANAKAESVRLTKEEAKLLKKLSTNFGVDTAYLKAFANGKPMRNVNKNALKAKVNKDTEVAKIKATAVKVGLMGKAKPVIKFIKNANYNATLATAKRNMNARIANRDKKNTEAKAKQATKNTKKLIAKLAKSGPIKVDAAYVEAFLADNAHKLFDAQKLNANRSKLNARIKADDELANIRAAEGGGKKRIQYTKVSDYVNARQKAANDRMTRSATPNKAKTKELTSSILNKLKKAGTPANASYVSKFLAENKKLTALTLEANVQPIITKIQKDQKVADLNATDVKEWRGWSTKKGTLKYISGPANVAIKAAENRLRIRQEKKKAEENKAGRKSNAKTLNIAARGEAISQKIRNTSGITTEAKNALANEIRKDLTSKLTGRRAKWVNNVELNKRLKKLQSDPKTRARMSTQKTFRGNRREENVNINAFKKTAGFNNNGKPNNAKKPNVNMRKQLKLEAAKRRESKNEFQNASNKTFNERNAELGREKTRLVQRVNKNIPGVFGQYRRTWQANIRQVKNKNALTAIEKLLNEKVRLRSEIQSAKISNKDRSGHLRWVMQKRNDVQKRRQELARHVNAANVAAKKKAEANVAAKKKAEANAAAKKKAEANAAEKKAEANAAAKKKAEANAAAKKKAEANAAAKKKAEANAAAKKKAEANAAAKKKANAERNALKREIQGSNIGVKNRTRFIRDLNTGKKVASVRKQFNAKKKAPKSKTVTQLAAPVPNKKPVASKAGTKALNRASKKKELAGKLRLAAKKSVAQNIKKSNLGNKSKQKLLTELKKKKTGPKRVQNNLKKKMSSGGMRSYRTRKQLNQKFTFATAKNTKPTRSESWRFK
jgi:hypothetical protein